MQDMQAFKVIILGDSGVGKTSLIENFLGKDFTVNHHYTMGVDFNSQVVQIEKAIGHRKYKHYLQMIEQGDLPDKEAPEFVKLHLWDTAGQEKYHAMIRSYYRQTNGVIFVFDLTDPYSLEHLKDWIVDFNRHSEKTVSDVPVVIVANKTDQIRERAISDTEIEQFATLYDYPIYNVSCKKDRERIKKIFHDLTASMFQQYLTQAPKEEQERIQLVRKANKNKKSKKKCRC